MNKEHSVLVIDDEKDNILLLTRILSPDYTVYASKSGKNGFNVARSNLPDVILLDILMPEMDGYEVLHLLKNSEETKEIPVVFVTGLTDSGDEEKGLALGAADYIVKPFDPAIVKLRVQNQINIINQTRLKIEKEAAEQSSKAKTDFLSRISHEMLTPMNVIMGMMKIVRMTNHSKDMSEIFDDIDDAARLLLELIYDMLDLNAIEKNTFKLNVSEFTFAAMLNYVLKTTNPYIKEKEQIFSCNIDESVPDMMIGDQYRLAQAIRNLLINAGKFTQDGGEIRLRVCAVHEEEGQITLQVEVTDNGIGISSDQQAAVLETFEQADGSAARRFEGAGLGLPISKQIIEKMGGEIWFESEPGKGTKVTFTVKLNI